jgi:sulfhydrogenase subunit beta (sulfur reductase)
MVTEADLREALAGALAQGYRVFAPVRRERSVLMEAIDQPGSVDFDHVLTTNTLKDVLLPRCEPLFAFDRSDQSITRTDEGTDRILIFGSRPCDAAALAILDAILLGRVRDARYAARRERVTVVTVGCSEGDDACFCTSMGYGPHDPAGSDVIVLPARDSFVVRAVTARGTEFLREVGLAEDTDTASDKPPELTRHTDTAKMKTWLDANFDSPKWRLVSENCLGCGACYYLCPTCHCFDITDEAGLSRGERMRIWDCCSFAGFTRMASHQPRPTRYSRYRQRIMHKFSYCVDNVGKIACVGDGRCIRVCPAGVDLCEVVQTLQDEG